MVTGNPTVTVDEPPAVLPPYWVELGYREVEPHLFEHRATRSRVLSAERTWAYLRHNAKAMP